MKNKAIKQLVVNAMYIALLVVSSFISIPINQIPYTLQTLVVFIILVNVDFKNSLIIFILYLIMGLIGLPVFSSFGSGITPTLGFIFGFVISVFIYNLFNYIIKINNNKYKIVIVLFICLIIIDICGSLFFMMYLDYNFIESITISVLPYILFDIIKMIIAVIISNRLKKIEEKYDEV